MPIIESKGWGRIERVANVFNSPLIKAETDDAEALGKAMVSVRDQLGEQGDQSAAFFCYFPRSKNGEPLPDIVFYLRFGLQKLPDQMEQYKGIIGTVSSDGSLQFAFTIHTRDLWVAIQDNQYYRNSGYQPMSMEDKVISLAELAEPRWPYSRREDGRLLPQAIDVNHAILFLEQNDSV